MNTEKKEKGKDGQSDKKIILRLLKLSWNYRSGCIRAIILQVVLLAFALGGLSLTGVGIDYIHHRLIPASKPPMWPFGLVPPGDWSDMKVLGTIAAAIIILAVLRAGIGYAYSVTVVKLLQQNIVVDLRAMVYEKMQKLSFRFFDSRTSGTLINRVTGDVQSTRLFIDGVLIQGAMLIVSIGVYLSYMLFINVRLTVLCLVTVPFMIFISIYFSRKLKPAYTRDRELFDGMILDLCERIQGVHVVKGFARENEELKRLAGDNAAVREQKYRIFNLISLFGPLIEFLNQINIVVLLLYGGYLVMNNELSLGTGLMVFLGLMQRFSLQINTLTSIVDNIQQSIAAAIRVFEILDTPVEVKSADNAVRIKRSNGEVSFRNVSFGYNPGEKALNNVSFDVGHGQFVGILGTTGSGKSTILSLIPRFYEVTKGGIFLDGKDIRSIDLDDLRKQVGIVLQESFLFSNTIAANISFGHPNASREEIIRAAKIASAHEFISALPSGYDTVIGEAGSDLSGGQRQRLAIARSILLEPPILLLDDPTAAVDSHTEKEIFEGIESAMQGRTTFLVTHRISVLKRADFILVLNKGKIIQQGTHEELINTAGHYRKAANIQIDDAKTGTESIPERQGQP